MLTKDKIHMNLHTEMLSVGQKNPIVAAAIAEIRLRQYQIKQEQDELLLQNKIAFEEANELSGDSLAKMTQDGLSSDEDYVSIFTSGLSEYPNKMDIPSSVKTNKMSLIFYGTRNLFGDDETNISRIASGQMPIGYSNNTDYFPELNSGMYWGTSAVSYLSNAALSVHFTLTGKTIKDIPLSSAITHVAPLPNALSLDDRCRYAYQNESLSGFGYVHSGYSFGGHRFEERLYPTGKQFGPEDCSSWVAKVTGSSILYSTADQLCANRLLTSQGFVPEQWQSEPVASEMTSLYEAVSPESVSPGDIHVLRVFDRSKSINDSLGLGGHTTIVLGQKDKNTLLTLGYNRDMPHIEGFGIQEYPINYQLTETRARLVMFKRVRKTDSTYISEGKKTDYSKTLAPKA